MNRQEMIALLGSLNSVWGTSGHEQAVGDRLGEYLADCTDEQFEDALGNRFFVKTGTHPDFKVMVSAHMDEIGFIVQDIWDDGYVAFLPVGMHDTRLLVNQVLTVHTACGDVEGVVGIKPVHQGGPAGGAPTYTDLKLDVGTFSRADTEALGIRPGDPITNERGWRMLGDNVFSGKAVDNRAGCAAMIAAMRQLKDLKLDATVVCCGSAMEEMGVKGSGPAAQRIRPDVAICLDVCFGAADGEINANNRRNELGKGPALMFYDWNNTSCLGNIVPQRLRTAMVDAAEAAGCPYQIGVTMNCGTDAAMIAYAGIGILTGGIGIPNRYMHSAVGTVCVDDVLHAGEILAHFIKDAAMHFEIQN
ncbi:MAG: M20/M25/M40 family metallo-hydrolase [Oscillibacter sp.]|jgi:endoglucanase|nr:M20/M25/M40 family metallo-hydrolase [Oscillibacter sp.]